jgi:hypothetical protein
MKKLFLAVIVTFASLYLVAIDPLPGSCDEPVKTKETAAMKLTVADAVFIALTNNVTLRSAYLDRYLNRIDLQLAERRFFLPTDPALTLSTNRVSTYVPPTAASAAGRIEDLNATGVLSATLAMPTGGTFTFAWNNKSDRPDLGQNFNYSSDWSLTLNQPLLKGGGMDNAAYNVRIARITEEKNVLSLKDTIIATIKTAIPGIQDRRKANGYRRDGSRTGKSPL